jgi:hypothetical protein
VSVAKPSIGLLVNGLYLLMGLTAMMASPQGFVCEEDFLLNPRRRTAEFPLGPEGSLIGARRRFGHPSKEWMVPKRREGSNSAHP